MARSVGTPDDTGIDTFGGESVKGGSAGTTAESAPPDTQSLAGAIGGNFADIGAAVSSQGPGGVAHALDTINKEPAFRAYVSIAASMTTGDPKKIFQGLGNAVNSALGSVNRDNTPNIHNLPGTDTHKAANPKINYSAVTGKSPNGEQQSSAPKYTSGAGGQGTMPVARAKAGLWARLWAWLAHRPPPGGSAHVGAHAQPARRTGAPRKDDIVNNGAVGTVPAYGNLGFKTAESHDGPAKSTTGVVNADVKTAPPKPTPIGIRAPSPYGPLLSRKATNAKQ